MVPLILRVTPFPNGALTLPWDLRRRTTDGAPRFTFGAGISLASALACSFAFCGASIGRLACERFYDFQRSRSKLDADRDCYYPNRVCSSVVVTTVGRLAWRPLFYRRLPAQILGASRTDVRPRIRLVCWLHTVLNRDSSQRHWVSDSIRCGPQNSFRHLRFCRGCPVSGINLIDSRVENGPHRPHQFWLKLRWCQFR